MCVCVCERERERKREWWKEGRRRERASYQKNDIIDIITIICLSCWSIPFMLRQIMMEKKVE